MVLGKKQLALDLRKLCTPGRRVQSVRVLMEKRKIKI